MIPVYYGFDPREEIGSHTFASSLIHHSSHPLSMIPMHLEHFKSFYAADQRDGTNNFIYTRFLIPFLQRYNGFAIFFDGADMILKADIAELWALRDYSKAVQVVKHDYKTSHPRKYVGTTMEADNSDYERKNWSSVMLINCRHGAWRDMTPEAVERMTGSQLHRFQFLSDDLIGEIPPVWNWLADEYGPNPEAKLLHWTAGIPAWEHYKQAPHADDWREAYGNVNHAA